MRPLITLFLLFQFGICFAQKSQIQHLEDLKVRMRHATYHDSKTLFKLGKECIQLAKKLKRENEIGLVYQYYGNFNYYSSNTEMAKKYYKKSIEVANRTKDFKLKNATQLRMTFILMDSDVMAAESAFRKLLAEAKKHKYIENQIEIYNGLGIMYEIRLQDDKAMKNYLLGLRISEKYHKDYFTGFLLNNLGLIKLEGKRYKSAEKDLQRALYLATKAKESRLRFNVLNNLGLVNKKTGDYAASIKHYKQTVLEARKIGFPNSIITAYINLSSSYLDNGQTKEAAATADTAIAMITPNMEPNFKIAAQLMKGLVATEQKDFATADKCVLEATRLLKAYQDPNQGPELVLLQAKLAEAKGDFKMAYQFEKEYHNLSDSIREISNENELTRHQTIYGKERMESELTNLHQRNTILRTESELKTVNLRFIIILLLSLFLLIVGGVYIYNIRKSRKVKALFSQKLIEQIDEERSRISKDLHDDIGQSLAVVKSKLNLYSTGKIDQIDGVDAEIGDILEQTRLLSHQLHPAALEKLGLERSLNSLIEKTQSSTDMVCSIDFELDSAKLSLESSSQMYRIVQECISNTIKHAKATALKVSCFDKNGEVTLEYRDNGIGFSEGENKAGLGLLTIRERAMIIGGKVDIKSGTNKGVLLTLTF